MFVRAHVVSCRAAAPGLPVQEARVHERRRGVVQTLHLGLGLELGMGMGTW